MGDLPDAVVISLGPLTFESVVAVARRDAPVRVHEDAFHAVTRSHERVQRHLDGDASIYGLTTGLGALADVRIPPRDLEELQHNTVRSHAAGAGEPLPREVVRAMMLLRARTLAQGYSGIRPVVVERLVELLNAGITPLVPSRGSVGASGDLAQLAHVALAATGEGRVVAVDGRVEPARDALTRERIEPLRLEAKESLALINGTEGMVALGVLAHHDAGLLLRTADVSGAMTIEGALGTDRPFAEDLMAMRPHPGQAASAANIRALLDGSGIVASHRDSPHVVQDPYSIRCTPQVHGAARDAHTFCGDVLTREMGSVIDNPVVLDDGRVESNGNFHGQPVAHALDVLSLALSTLGNVSERRTYWLLGPGQSRGLPAFLTPEPGLRSGYMLAQYTQAALVSECKVLAHPASLDTIPTSGTQEDHVSMGWLAGLKARQIAERVRTILAIEAICAAQALDLRRPFEPAVGTAAAHAALRERIPFLDEDREVAADIASAEELVATGAVLAAAERAAGDLA